MTSDCGAIDDIYRKHKWVETAAEASGRAMAAGEDLNCGSTFQSACKEAIQRGFLTEAQLDTALVRVLEARFSLGEFDDKSDVEWTQIDSSVLDSQAHRDLALKAAHESIVLLKNDGILPLSKKLGKIAVIGPLADTMNLGGYSGSPVDTTTIVEGIAGKLGVNSSQLLYVKGCAVNNHNETDINAAVLAAEKADVVILALGTNLKSSDEGRDRQSLALPGDQQKLLEEVYKANHNVVLLLQTCSSVDVNWAQEHVPAIVEAWYDGQAQGKAVADVLFGDFNPSGKLTSTWYASADDLPDDMLDYNIDEAGYTYMYLTKAPLYPFGYGLSYTSFEYSGLKISHSAIEKGKTVDVSFNIRNIGDRSGAEIPQLYIHTNGRLGGQLKQLRGFDRIELQPGESKTVTFHLPYSALAHYDEDAHIWIVEQGNVDIMVGASSSDIRLRAGVVVKKGSSTVSPFLL